MSKVRKYLSKHPESVLIIFCLFFMLSVFFAPRWFVFVLIGVLLASSIYIILLDDIKNKQAKKRMQNLCLEDFRKMYSEYDALVESKLEELDYSRDIIRKNWLEEFHEYFYIASDITNKTMFTDFHIAASMFFALVSETPSLNQVCFAYECIKWLISNPREYVRHIDYGSEIKLEVETTLEEADYSLIEERVAPDELCKIIKEVYLTNKTESSLIGLADFLGSLYERCH